MSSSVTVKRLPHWERLLAAHLNAAAGRRFAWGSFDCALAACDGVQAITGIDPGSPYRGQYDSAAGAAAIATPDLGSFAAGICVQHGFPEWMDDQGQSRPGFARRGDLALIRYKDPAAALGTVGLDGRFALCASQRGFLRVPMKFALRAWKIG